MYNKITRRYSNALYDVAVSEKNLEKVINDSKSILEIIKSSTELLRFFQSPIISKSKKISAIKEIFKDRVSEITLKFILILVDRGRENIITYVFNDFLMLINEKEGIVNAYVTTAIDLTIDERSKLIKMIENYTSKKVNPTFNIDKNIIGGFIVDIEDTILNASIKRQLELLKEQFRKSDFVLN